MCVLSPPPPLCVAALLLPPIACLQTPPLTTEELVLYLQASLHRGKWGMLAPIATNSFVPKPDSAAEAPAVREVIGEFCHPLDTACVAGPAVRGLLLSPSGQRTSLAHPAL